MTLSTVRLQLFTVRLAKRIWWQSGWRSPVVDLQLFAIPLLLGAFGGEGWETTSTKGLWLLSGLLGGFGGGADGGRWWLIYSCLIPLLLGAFGGEGWETTSTKGLRLLSGLPTKFV